MLRVASPGVAALAAASAAFLSFCHSGLQGLEETAAKAKDGRRPRREGGGVRVSASRATESAPGRGTRGRKGAGQCSRGGGWAARAARETALRRGGRAVGPWTRRRALHRVMAPPTSERPVPPAPRGPRLSAAASGTGTGRALAPRPPGRRRVAVRTRRQGTAPRVTPGSPSAVCGALRVSALLRSAPAAARNHQWPRRAARPLP